MYWCDECDHGFLDVAQEPDDAGGFYDVCPYCGSEWIRDVAAEADAALDRMKEEGLL